MPIINLMGMPIHLHHNGIHTQSIPDSGFAFVVKGRKYEYNFMVGEVPVYRAVNSEEYVLPEIDTMGIEPVYYLVPEHVRMAMPERLDLLSPRRDQIVVDAAKGMVMFNGLISNN